MIDGTNRYAREDVRTQNLSNVPIPDRSLPKESPRYLELCPVKKTGKPEHVRLRLLRREGCQSRRPRELATPGKLTCFTGLLEVCFRTPLPLVVLVVEILSSDKARPLPVVVYTGALFGRFCTLFLHSPAQGATVPLHLNPRCQASILAFLLVN